MKLLELLRELRGLNRKQLTLVYRTAKQIDISRQGFARYDGDPTPEDVKAVKSEFDVILAEFSPKTEKPEKEKKPKKEKKTTDDVGGVDADSENVDNDIFGLETDQNPKAEATEINEAHEAEIRKDAIESVFGQDFDLETKTDLEDAE